MVPIRLQGVNWVVTYTYARLDLSQWRLSASVTKGSLADALHVCVQYATPGDASSYTNEAAS